MKRTIQEFIELANKVHHNKYSYTRSIYVHSKVPLIITCPTHGDWKQTPGNHLSGKGCLKCAGKASYTTKDFVNKSKTIHGDLYDYSNTVYTNAKNKVNINCKGHGIFSMLPGNHYKGQGCPSCANHGFNKSKPALLYYLKVVRDNEVFYKIGITNRTIKERFGSDMQYIEVLNIKYFLNGSKASQLEQWLLSRYSDYKILNKHPLKIGNTELFNIDIRNINE